jgi:tight adherence protein C
VTTMAGRVAEPINRMVPISAVEAEKLQKQLLQAGYRSPEAATAFRAIQITLLIAMPTLVATVCFILERPANNFFIWGIIGAAFGFYLPKYVLIKKTTARQQRITWALADMMDLMVVAVEAGLALNAALNRVGDELKDLHPDMHYEIDLVNLEIRVGRSREESLRNLAERTGVDDIRAFVALLIQADRYGSSIAKAVRIFADSLRTKRRQRAEQASQKAALKLIFPLTLFLFPVILLVVLGPALLNLYDILFQ